MIQLPIRFVVFAACLCGATLTAMGQSNPWKIEIETADYKCDFGDPVYIRVTIRNVSDKSQIGVLPELSDGLSLSYKLHEAEMSALECADLGGGGGCRVGDPPTFELQPGESRNFYCIRNLQSLRPTCPFYWDKVWATTKEYGQITLYVYASYYPLPAAKRREGEASYLVAATDHWDLVYYEEDQPLLDMLSQNKQRSGIPLDYFGYPDQRVSAELMKTLQGKFKSERRNELVKFYLLLDQLEQATDVSRPFLEKELQQFLNSLIEIKRLCLMQYAAGSLAKTSPQLVQQWREELK